MSLLDRKRADEHAGDLVVEDLKVHFGGGRKMVGRSVPVVHAVDGVSFTVPTGTTAPTNSEREYATTLMPNSLLTDRSTRSSTSPSLYQRALVSHLFSQTRTTMVRTLSCTIFVAPSSASKSASKKFGHH